MHDRGCGCRMEYMRGAAVGKKVPTPPLFNPLRMSDGWTRTRSLAYYLGNLMEANDHCDIGRRNPRNEAP